MQEACLFCEDNTQYFNHAPAGWKFFEFHVCLLLAVVGRSSEAWELVVMYIASKDTDTPLPVLSFCLSSGTDAFPRAISKWNSHRNMKYI